MACDLTTGLAKGCKDVMAGIKYAYFTTDALGTATYDTTDTDMIATWDGTTEYQKYDLYGDNNSAELGAWTSDPNNRTGFFAQSVNLQFSKLNKETHKELKLLMYASPTVVLETYNNEFFVLGLQNGMDATGGTIPTGGASGDLQGYTLTMTGKELKPANFIDVTDLASAGTLVTVNAVQIAP